jgi:hypothetical protein
MSDQEEHIEVNLEEPKVEAPAKKEELEIEVVDEKPKKEAKKPEITPKEGIDELKKRLENERQARIQAEYQAQHARKQAEEAKTETQDANYQLVVNAIETIKERSESIKTAYAEAMSVGDFKTAASLQEALSINSSQLSELKRGEKAMKEKIEEQKSEVKPIAAPNVHIADQLSQNVSPRSAAWLRDNRDTIKDERTARKMFRAHEDAVDEGLAPDSDEYFGFIEQRLGIRRNDEGDDALSEAAAPAPKRNLQPPPAPVSRGNQRPNVVRLTREQVEMAKMMGMTETDYAKNMQALQREGKIGH